MANEQNLIPLNKRSQRERKEIAKKGAKASNEKQKAKKTFRECMSMMLALPVNNTEDVNKLAELGIDFDIMDNRALVTAALMRKAMEGDVQAVKEIRNMIGEDSIINDVSKEKEVSTLFDALGSEDNDII